jgi:signal transduction histidine kinase
MAILIATLSVATFTIFLFFMTLTLNRIDAASREAESILQDWLKAESLLLAGELDPESMQPGEVGELLDACDSKLRSVSSEPLLAAMRKLDDRPTVERELGQDWMELRAAWTPSGRAPAGQRPPLAHRLSLAKGFETALRERIALISRFGSHQRTSLVYLRVSSIIAVLALVAAGFWTAKSARQSQRDQARLRELIRATYAGQEKERSRIALDLHDSIAQDLASSLMLARRLAENPGGDQGRLVSSLKTSLDALRRLSWELRPPELERLGFEGAAMRLCADYEERKGCPVRLEMPELEPGRLGIEAELHLYRILQEALSNIAKHAKARQVAVQIASGPDRLLLSIRDDGRGFDLEAAGHSGSAPDHLGLAGMRERARLIGGRLTVASATGRGTSIEVEVPYV